MPYTLVELAVTRFGAGVDPPAVVHIDAGLPSDNGTADLKNGALPVSQLSIRLAHSRLQPKGPTRKKESPGFPGSLFFRRRYYLQSFEVCPVRFPTTVGGVAPPPPE
jgi:hypothetical protein